MPPATRKAKSRPEPVNEFIRTRLDHQTELAEDYVELIAELIEESGEARAVDIAKRLGVSHVTVTNALKRLQDMKLVSTRPYRSIFLTAAGKAMAQKCRERHGIVMHFLLALGIPPEVAVVDAEGIEHHVSAITLDAMREFAKDKLQITKDK